LLRPPRAELDHQPTPESVGIAHVAPFVEIIGEPPLDDDVLLALLTGRINIALNGE